MNLIYWLLFLNWFFLLRSRLNLGNTYFICSAYYCFFGVFGLLLILQIKRFCIFLCRIRLIFFTWGFLWYLIVIAYIEFILLYLPEMFLWFLFWLFMVTFMLFDFFLFRFINILLSLYNRQKLLILWWFIEFYITFLFLLFRFGFFVGFLYTIMIVVCL